MPTIRPAAALLIAAIAGAVDAIGFLMLDGLFAASVSGDVTRMGLALDQRFYATAGLALGIVLLFVGGAAAGTLIGARLVRARSAVLLAVAAVLVVASVVLVMRGFGSGTPTLVMAMGLLNTVWPGLGVTYVTGALVRIGAALGGDALARQGFGFDVGVAVAFTSGVLVAARVYPIWGAVVLAGPAALLALAALAQVPALVRRKGPWA